MAQDAPPADEMHVALRRHMITVIVEGLQEAGLKLTAGRIREIEGGSAYGEVTVVFRSAVNQISATAALSYDTSSALETCSALLKKTVTEIDEEIDNCLLDATKKMCVALQRKLKEKRCIMSVAAPTVIRERGSEIEKLVDEFPIRVPFRTAKGGWLVLDIAIVDI